MRKLVLARRLLWIDGMRGFQDQTSSWFDQGEDPEVIAHTKETQLPRRKWPRVLGVCVTLALASGGVTWTLVGTERPSNAEPPPPAATSSPMASPVPGPAASPTILPSAPPAATPAKPTDRAREWRRENIIGERLLQKGRNGFALERFQRVLENKPNDERALRGKCMALDRLGRRNEAADACRRALRQNPNDLQARRTLARIYYLGGAYTWSAAEWRKVLASNPKDREARNGLRAAESKRRTS